MLRVLYFKRYVKPPYVTTSICALVYRWKALYLVNLVSIMDHRLYLKILRNLFIYQH